MTADRWYTEFFAALTIMMTIQQRIIEAGTGANGLPVMARMGDDPGEDYFNSLLVDLRLLFDELQACSAMDKSLAYALYALGHYPAVEYSNWQHRGRRFRENLHDPQIFQLEMAVESILTGEWSDYLAS